MNYYLLFKSLHLISVISWMAGLLYLPRLFVYHSETTDNDKQKEGNKETLEQQRDTHQNEKVRTREREKPNLHRKRKRKSKRKGT